MAVATGLVGDTDAGKTYQALATYCGLDACYVAGPKGLRVGDKALGFDPKARTFTFEYPTIELYTEAVGKLARKYKRIVLDEVSAASKATYAALKIKYAGKKNTAERYERLEMAIGALFTAIAASGVDACLTMHVKKGKFDDRRGEYLPGGPDLKGWEARKPIVYGLDDLLIIRGAPGAFPVPTEFFCPGLADPHWVTKGRSDVLHLVRPTGPANLRAYLRAAGDAPLPRLPGLEWQNTAAQRCCDRICAGEDPRVVYADLAGKLRERLPGAKLQWIRWALQDGCADAAYKLGPDILTLPSDRTAGDALAALAEVAPAAAAAAAAATGAAGTTADGDDDDEDDDE